MEIAGWLRSLGLAQYEATFREHEIDSEVLPELAEVDFEKLGIPLGHRKRLLKAIRALDSMLPVSEQASLFNFIPAVGGLPERRQLTVMFCDLVGSTALSTRLDPEDLREVIGAYHRSVAEIVRRFDGFVAKYMGDGVLIYFGFPRAHEDDAERAIRTGLDLISEIGKLKAPEYALEVRIGVATGLVVVGDPVGEGASQERAVVGQTPNLAARLQAIAQPGTIVLPASTRRLIGNVFKLRDLGHHDLKGLTGPIEVWAVEGVSLSESRFELLRAARMSELVGREAELGLLMDRWELARAGEGQIVLLCGEPGIGKSRILNELHNRLKTQEVGALRFHCSPYYTNTAFYPIIDNFERALKFGRSDTNETKLDKLETLVTSHYGCPQGDVHFIASLLSIHWESRYGDLAITPQRFKDETLRVLVDIVEAASLKQPTVLLFEDLHWADPTTLEVLDFVIDRMRGLPLLSIMTHRPEFQSRWSNYGHVTTLTLTKLARVQSETVVSKLALGKALPPDLLEQILSKTDGIPLFIEELTKSVLESQELRDVGDHYDYAGDPRELAVPLTLRDSLMARLDRFTPVKEVAQIGAAIGQEFSYELVTMVAPHSKPELNRALSQLVASGLAFAKGEVPNTVYRFKHALVRDAAYDSLLKTSRLEVHGKIARVIESLYAGHLDENCELLAYHFSQSADVDKALIYLDQANRKAIRSNAMPEAKAYFDQAMLLLDRAPDNDENRRRRLTLLANQAPAMVLLFKFAECYELLTRYEPMGKELGDPGLLASFYGCLGHCRWFFGEWDKAIETLDLALRLSEDADSPESASYAYMLLEWTHLLLGDFDRVYDFNNLAVTYLNRRFNLRTHTWARAAASMSYTFQGRWDEALHESMHVMQRAEEFADKSNISFAAMTFCLNYAYKGDRAAALRFGALALEKVVTPADQVWASGFNAVAVCRAGEPHLARETLSSIVDIQRRAGFLVGEFFTLWLGEACLIAGDVEEAIRTLENAVVLYERRNMRFFLGSAHRILAEALLQSLPSADDHQVEAHLITSIRILDGINARHELALTYACYGNFCARRSRLPHAHKYLGRALELLECLGTSGKLEEVRHELKELSKGPAR